MGFHLILSQTSLLLFCCACNALRAGAGAGAEPPLPQPPEAALSCQ
jgi:hypothetical protein